MGRVFTSRIMPASRDYRSLLYVTSLAIELEVPIQSYRDLHAWNLGMDFVIAVYRLTRGFPREELYGLTAQLRRAAVAVPSNVSEGHQQSTKVYLRHVAIAAGSAAEAETQLEIARRLGYASDTDVRQVMELTVHVRRVLFGLRRSLRKRASREGALIPNP